MADQSELLSLLPWARTLHQKRVIEAMLEHGDYGKAAAAVGVSRVRIRSTLSDIRRRAAKSGWAPAHDMTHAVPDGFHVRGVSTLYGADGEIRQQWVKSRSTEDERLDALMAAVQEIGESFAGVHAPVAVGGNRDEDLLVVYPIGDAHIGMVAWGPEAGEDFDLKIAERDLVTAVDHLVDLAPPAKQAIVASLGDMLHADGKRNTTTAGTAVDVDTRWSKMFAIAIRAMRRCIDRALEKHETVRVVCVTGNHDEHLSLVLAHCLALYYEREPRVEVDTSPSKFFWHRFGKCLLGFHHGDSCKKEALPGVMACDRSHDWGQTEHRAFYLGHIHHEVVKEFPGVVVESFRTLAAKDAWHAAAGYRSGRDMKCDVWHREHGRVLRHCVGISQIRSKF